MSRRELSQLEMVHRLPKAKLVDRIPYLCSMVAGKRTVHVGFVDAGCQYLQEQADGWLHGHLDRSAAGLIGLDLDEDGVERARAADYEAYVVDCRDPEAIRALGLEPTEVIVAGEIIEHLDDAGSFLDGLHALLAQGGTLVLTTPNPYGLLNVAASVIGYEINHPDHVTMYTWRTLTHLLDRHGWDTVETKTFVPRIKERGYAGLKMRLLALGASLVLWIERIAGRLGMPFAADGLIIVSRPHSSRSGDSADST